MSTPEQSSEESLSAAEHLEAHELFRHYDNISTVIGNVTFPAVIGIFLLSFSQNLNSLALLWLMLLASIFLYTGMALLYWRQSFYTATLSRRLQGISSGEPVCVHRWLKNKALWWYPLDMRITFGVGLVVLLILWYIRFQLR